MKERTPGTGTGTGRGRGQAGREHASLEEYVAFVQRLRHLARGAVADGHRLHCHEEL